MKYLNIRENLQQARSILKKKGVDENDPRFDNIRKFYDQIIGSNLGYIGFLTHLRFNKDVSEGDIFTIIRFIADNKDIIKSLPKNITQYKDQEKLWDDIEIQKDWKKYRQEFVNELSGVLKQKAKKDEGLKTKYINSDEETQKDILKNFIPKVARYKDYDKFKSDLNAFLNKTDNIEDILKSINNQEHAKLVYNENNIIVAQVYKYKASCDLGSKSWCISTGESYWNSYVSGLNMQYFIWNLNVPKSSNASHVGATVRKDGTVYTAHYKNDTQASLEKYANEHNIPMEVFRPFDVIQDFENVLKAGRINNEVIEELLNADNKELIEKYFNLIPNDLKIKYGLYEDGDLDKMNISDFKKSILKREKGSNERIIKLVESSETEEGMKKLKALSFSDIIYLVNIIYTRDIPVEDTDVDIILQETCKYDNYNVIEYDSSDEKLIIEFKDEDSSVYETFFDMSYEFYHNISSITSHNSMYYDSGELDYCLRALNNDQQEMFIKILNELSDETYHKEMAEYFTDMIKKIQDYEGIEYHDTETFFNKIGLSDLFTVFDLSSDAVEDASSSYIQEDSNAFDSLDDIVNLNRGGGYSYRSSDPKVEVSLEKIIESFSEDQLNDQDFKYEDWISYNPFENMLPTFHMSDSPYDYYGMGEISDEYEEKITNLLQKILNDVEYELDDYFDNLNKVAHDRLLNNGYEDTSIKKTWSEKTFVYKSIKNGVVNIIPLHNIIENGNAVSITVSEEKFNKDENKIGRIDIKTDGKEDKRNTYYRHNIKDLFEEGINVKQINIYDQFDPSGTSDPDQLNLFEEKFVISFKNFKQRGLS